MQSRDDDFGSYGIVLDCPKKLIDFETLSLPPSSTMHSDVKILGIAIKKPEKLSVSESKLSLTSKFHSNLCFYNSRTTNGNFFHKLQTVSHV